MLVGGAMIGGCAAQPERTAGTEPIYRQQTDGPALALVCDPPCTAGEPPLYLDRDARQPGAFAGYDQPTVTYSYLRVDDRYQPFGDGRYDRQAVTEREGVSTR
jgi:hypothetical protein